MRSTTIAAAGAAAALLCAGPALAATKTFEVAAFTAIEISSGIDATIIVGEPQSVVAEAPSAEQFEDLVVEVKDGRLRAYTDWNLLTILRPLRTRNITLTITVPAVTAIESNSGADVRAADIAADRLALGASSGANLSARNVTVGTIDLEASSGANIAVSGTCETAEADATSGADLDARDLACASVEVEVSSGGRADVRATASLDAEASSGGDIEVFGNPPSRNVERSSGGSVRFRD